MKNSIKTSIVWSLTYSDKKIKTDYILEVPKGITPSFYLWISTGMRISYKNQCFINKLKGSKECVFKNTTNLNNYPII